MLVFNLNIHWKLGTWKLEIGGDVSVYSGNTSVNIRKSE